MKRTLSDELLPTPSQQPQSELTTATLPNTTAEQTRSEPTLLNRTAVNPSIEMVTAVNQPPIQPSEHSTPEKSDRSSSASSSVSSATTDDEITLLQKAAWSGDAESQFRLGKCYISGKGVEINNEYALMWFTKADLQNHKESEIVMKAMYANGLLGENFPIRMVKFFRQICLKYFLLAEIVQGRFSLNILPALKVLVCFGFQFFSREIIINNRQYNYNISQYWCNGHLIQM